MDNCTAHPELIAPNVKTLFLPPNTTSLIQPMDQGVINSLKCNYRSAFLRRLLNSESPPNMIAEFKNEFNIRDCLYMLRDAWDSVTQESLMNSWHKLWPESLLFETEDDGKEFCGFKPSLAKIKSDELLHFAQSNTQLPNLHLESLLEFFETDDEPQTVNNLTDVEIISSVLNQGEISSEIELETEEEIEKLSILEGISLLGILEGDRYFKFLERQDCVTEEELKTIHGLQEKLFVKRLQNLKQTKINFV